MGIGEGKFNKFFEEKCEKEGIQFHDITMIFKDEKETIYSDDCCHLNKKGNDVLAHHIGQTILKYYENNSGHLITR